MPATSRTPATTRPSPILMREHCCDIASLPENRNFVMLGPPHVCSSCWAPQAPVSFPRSSFGEDRQEVRYAACSAMSSSSFPMAGVEWPSAIPENGGCQSSKCPPDFKWVRNDSVAVSASAMKSVLALPNTAATTRLDKICTTSQSVLVTAIANARSSPEPEIGSM